MSIKILVVDDHAIVRMAIRRVIETEESLEVVGEARDGCEALKLAESLRPDLVVMDIVMPLLDGIEATRQILGALPGTRVLAYSGYSQEAYVLGALDAGAAGYMLKDCDTGDLICAIRAVGAGQPYFCPTAAKIVLDALRKRNSKGKTESHQALTNRECETLELLSLGRTTREMAEALGVSTRTIDTYRHQVKKKLNVRSVAELVRLTIREGLTPS